MNTPRALISAIVTASFVVTAAGATAPPAAAASLPDSVGDPWAQGTVSSVGKIIWDAGGDQVGLCSGAVVDAPNGSVIATAAHCVSSPEAPDIPREAWFVPGYDRGIDSYQEDGWKVTAYHLPAGWDVNRHLHHILPHDYAFLTVERKDGRTVQRAHGANRLAFAPIEEGGQVAVLGYPAADPYDGESLHYCAGPTRVLTEEDSASPNIGGLMLERCTMTAGSSGGPWLHDYDPGSQSGTVVGVTSVGSASGQVLGRPFPLAAVELFERAGSGGAKKSDAEGER